MASPKTGVASLVSESNISMVGRQLLRALLLNDVDVKRTRMRLFNVTLNGYGDAGVYVNAATSQFVAPDDTGLRAGRRVSHLRAVSDFT
jgi:hypothetical protein